MGPCYTYNSSLRFTRNFFGVAALAAYFLQSKVLVLVLGLIMVLAAISLKTNLIYQLHFKFFRKLFKSEDEPIAKDSGELSFAWGMGACFLLIPSLLFWLNKWPGLAWAMVVLDALLLLLAGIAGACVASILYAVTIKHWIKKDKPQA